jgi:uncharacterized protein YndB with AHSA1/START domain
MVTGQTKDVGFQIGVSKTLPVPVERLWTFLTGADGLATWLGDGEGVVLEPQKGARYETADGTVGEVRSFRELDRVRITWRPAGWAHDTTVQVAVRASGPGRSMLRFHQEWLADSEERGRQREHWQQVMTAVEEALGVAE